MNADTRENLGKVLIGVPIVVQHQLFEQEGLVNAPVALRQVHSQGLANAWIQFIPGKRQHVVPNPSEDWQILHILAQDAIIAVICIYLSISVVFVRLFQPK